MFSSKHYVPILKWKRAEQGALKLLKKEQKKYVTPLIQFVMPKYKSDEQLPKITEEDQLQSIISNFKRQIPQISKQLIEIWGFTPVFIDVSLLFTTQLKAESLNHISSDGYKLGGVFIPVIHLNDAEEIKDSVYSIVKKNKTGMCLRLICSDFFDLTELNRNISKLLSSSKLTEKEIDLLVDIKETEDNDNKYNKYLNLGQKILNLMKWRTFIFASGSFPENLSECKLDEENLIPRIDWKNWQKQINSKNLKRKPSFADFTIQHPIYKESSQFFHPTSSIKYTLENEWLIMKGQKQKFDRYLASAALLVKDSRYYGENFSYGDQYIAEKAKHFVTYIKNPLVKGTGSTETWLRAGINHHLVLVAHQVANLS